MAKSVTTFIELRMMSSTSRLTHLGLMLGFQSAAMGRHCKRLTMAAVVLYAATNANTHQRRITNLRTGKSRRYRSRIESLVAAIAGL